MALSQEVECSRRGGVRQMGAIWRHEGWELCAGTWTRMAFHRSKAWRILDLKAARRVAFVEVKYLSMSENQQVPKFVAFDCMASYQGERKYLF